MPASPDRKGQVRQCQPRRPFDAWLSDLAPNVSPVNERGRPTKAAQPVVGQLCLDDLGTPLHDATFVIVDLETTGSANTEHEITEIGAVKVRAGEVLGEYQTLIRTRSPVPAFISVLTGITDSMLVQAPAIGEALSSFLEFASGAILVAHNARFDVGFLKMACAQTSRTWPSPIVIDTLQLARAVIDRDEIPDHRLGTLAKLFRSPITPDHRALTDARATVDVLHGLIARLGGVGVTSVEELASYSRRVPERTRRKRGLADDLPHAPGVYQFVDGHGRVLYVGTSRDIRSRVRSYFTATEKRTRMSEMIGIAESVRAVECGTVLEAQVRELRLIAELDPPYNRRSRRPDRVSWLKLTVEPFPRLSIVRQVLDDGATYLGPYAARHTAEDAMAAIHEAIPLRQCTRRLPRRPSATARACMLAEIGRCPAPCLGGAGAESYPTLVEQARHALSEDPSEIVRVSLHRAQTRAAAARFEDAVRYRDRMLAVLRGAARTQRIRPLAGSAELVAARAWNGGWEIIMVRHGLLVGSAISPSGTDPRPTIESIRLSAPPVDPPVPPQPAGLTAEAELILTWLEQPGVRLVDLDGEWVSPAAGAAGALARLTPGQTAPESPPAERRR